MQPYAGVLLTKHEDRELLASAMLGSNVQKVKEAPLVMVFAADLEPSKRVPELQKLEYEAGASTEAIAKLPMHLRMFVNEGALGAAVKLALATTVTPTQPIPSYAPTIAWAYKHTIFAASTFLLAAESYGIATCPMEGFDETRVKYCVDLPDRYSVPVIIAAGYSGDDSTAVRRTPRFPLSDMFFSGKFGQSLSDVASQEQEKEATAETMP